MDAAPEKKPMPSPGSAISIRDASVYYDTYPALLKTNLDVERGQFVTIVGPNGGGKTTVFKLILGLVKPRSGSVRVLGMPPEAARTSLGYVPQNSSFDPLFPVRVSDIVRMGFLGSAYYPGFRNREETRARVLECLHDVGLEDRVDAWFNSLSGGQKQRVL
ncbi:MAG TPA: ATP-binding cassette domain-containing protein, partial [Candidatus Hydrogenedentes bacterium]|nr:ATP-binding cassette domain-containing protein [Candidatus Hydrogenedentota bacterium]